MPEGLSPIEAGKALHEHGEAGHEEANGTGEHANGADRDDVIVRQDVAVRPDDLARPGAAPAATAGGDRDHGRDDLVRDRGHRARADRLGGIRGRAGRRARGGVGAPPDEQRAPERRPEQPPACGSRVFWFNHLGLPSRVAEFPGALFASRGLAADSPLLPYPLISSRAAQGGIVRVSGNGEAGCPQPGGGAFRRNGHGPTPVSFTRWGGCADPATRGGMDGVRGKDDHPPTAG